MPAPGGPSDDPTKGFKFGGGAMPYLAEHFVRLVALLGEEAKVELQSRLAQGSSGPL